MNTSNRINVLYDICKNSSYTPGPWEVATPKYSYSWPSVVSTKLPNNGLPFTNIAKMDCSMSYGGSMPAETALANAKLIAAAPDLLAALDKFMNRALDLGSNGFSQEIAVARATIAQATGK